MNEKQCAYCSQSLEGRTFIASNGKTFCDNNGACQELSEIAHLRARKATAQPPPPYQVEFALGNE